MLKEGCEDVDWVHLAQNGVQWPSVAFVHREQIDERYWREEIICPKEVAYCTFFVHFIELGGSLPCLQGIITCSYPEPH